MLINGRPLILWAEVIDWCPETKLCDLLALLGFFGGLLIIRYLCLVLCEATRRVTFSEDLLIRVLLGGAFAEETWKVVSESSL